MKRERLNKSDEQRERQMIAEQIERAAATEQQIREEQEEEMSDDGNAEASTSADPAPSTELKRTEGEKVKLSISLKKLAAGNPLVASSTPAEKPPTSPVSSESASPTPGVKTDSTPAASSTPAAPVPVNVFKTNVFKMNTAKPAASSTNVFKMGGGSAAKSSSNTVTAAKRPLSVTEALMREDMERKRRRMDREDVRA